jgi:hypothetical protein
MKRKAARATLVYVRWFDSAIFYVPLQADELTGYCEMESAGFLVEETPDSLTLALDRTLDTGALRLMLCIPKVNVRSVRKVKVV